MKNNYGVNDIGRWKFDEPIIPEDWANHLGELPIPFKMYIDGEGGHGKTEYVMLLSKMSAEHIGKTLLNNVEQGKHKSIQMSWKRNRFKEEVKPGKWMYSSDNDFEQFKARLKKRNSGRVIIIDSISFWPLTVKQVQELFQEFPHKSFALIAYAADSTKNKAIKHLCDIKVRVENFKAYPRSRFEGNKPFTIAEHLHKAMTAKNKGYQQPGLFDT